MSFRPRATQRIGPSTAVLGEMRTYERENTLSGRYAARCTDESHADLLDTQWFNEKIARTSRQAMYNKYTVNKKIRVLLETNTFPWIDQGAVGGCAFAALSYLCALGGLRTRWETVTSRSMEDLRTECQFRQVYIDQLGMDDDGYKNWTRALEALGSTWEPLCQQLQWEYFKTARGDKFNASISSSKEPVVYAQAVHDWLVHCLSAGNAIAVPFAQHFCTLIGVDSNTGGFLFLGSYGIDGDWSEQGGLHELKVDPLTFADMLADCLIVKVR